MNSNSIRAMSVLASILISAASASAQRLPPEVAASNPRVYEITMTTKLVMPNDGAKRTMMRVWHGLPTPRPWDGLNRTLGASSIACQPDAGRVQHFAKNDSQHVYWEHRDGLEPGKTFEFVSRFQVRSADRTFEPERCPATWKDYPIYEMPEEVDAVLAAVVDKITKAHPPAQAALEFCTWVKDHVKYDPMVSFDSTDLSAILKSGKGHCGHQLTVFLAMCARARIPTKIVWGMNLYSPDGDGPQNKIRADYDNRHTWAQVFLPGSGWVEIDPGAGRTAYSIPGIFIQNSTDFPNYMVRIEQGGKWMRPSDDWTYRDGSWHSPYRLENRIAFRKVAVK